MTLDDYIEYLEAARKTHGGDRRLYAISPYKTIDTCQVIVSYTRDQLIERTSLSEVERKLGSKEEDILVII